VEKEKGEFSEKRRYKEGRKRKISAIKQKSLIKESKGCDVPRKQGVYSKRFEDRVTGRTRVSKGEDW